jgi:hypothetical protein
MQFENSLAACSLVQAIHILRYDVDIFTSLFYFSQD